MKIITINGITEYCKYCDTIAVHEGLCQVCINEGLL